MDCGHSRVRVALWVIKAEVVGFAISSQKRDPAGLAWPAAYAAFREVLPELPEAQAKLETAQAIAFAAANHTRWFWSGIYGER